jgi:hypothetical protein
MRSSWLRRLGLAAGTLAWTGCGVSHHLAKTPTSVGRQAQVVTVSPSMSSVPKASSTVTPPASGASRPETRSLNTTIAGAIDQQMPTMPIELPRYIPSVDSHRGWPVTATVATHSSPHFWYQVTFWRSPTALPINSSRLLQSPHVWIATIQGAHDGSTTKAGRALQARAAPTWISSTRLGRLFRSVLLAPGITARLYPSDVLQWTLGHWTFQVSNQNRAADMTVARSLLAEIHRTLLPAPHGLLAATATACGEQFQAAWVNGANVYAITPFAQRIRGNGTVYDRTLSAQSGSTLFLHFLSSIKAQDPREMSRTSRPAQK